MCKLMPPWGVPPKGNPALYSNIDHKEGVDACSYVLDKRTNQSFPTRVIVK